MAGRNRDVRPDPESVCEFPVSLVRGSADSNAGNDLLQGVRPLDPVAAAYAELLGRLAWQWFLTLTFRPQYRDARGGIHPEKADKAFRLLVSCINRECYGKNWHRRPHGGVVWARGQEFHKSGRIHFHAVAAAPTADLNALTRRLDWMDWWYREFGIARIERPSDQEDVARYVSKYVVKDGEIDFSRNFPATEQDVPPVMHLRNAAPPRLASFKRAPGVDGEPHAGSKRTEAEKAFRCLTLPERLQRGLLTPETLYPIRRFEPIPEPIKPDNEEP